MGAQKTIPRQNHDFGSPRPYSWQTDEYQTQSEVRPPQKTARANPLLEGFQNKHYGNQPLTYVGPQHIAGNYRCPNCGTQYLPVIERRISTAGWITFSLLLIFTIVFFWIGLMIKEEVRVCPVCRIKLG